jgi:glycosyltransferase involved in cell wall biosynthesis
MRIALLAWESKHSIAIGGLAEHVTELAAALQPRGHEIHVFTRVGPGQRGYDCIDGVHYHRCPYETHPDFFIDVERMGNSFVWHLVETESYLKARFDIVHGHDWLAVHALRQLKNDHDRPVVMTVHSTEFGRCGNQLFEGPSRRVRSFEWEGTYLAERVICVSNALRKEVQDLYSVPGDKMSVVYNGVDVHRFDTRVSTRVAREQYAIGREDPMVLFAGRMTWQKGPDLLVEAMPTLLRHHPNAKFVFAGDGDLRYGLERRAAALGVAPAARFVGHQKGRELVSLFKSADLVCVPSRNEPFGIVILEAWSARKPVVATRNGGPAEFIKHQNTGLMVSDDCHSIGRGVGAVLADKSEGRRMGCNGRREAESRFSWNTVAIATERVYQSVLENRYNLRGQSDARIEEIFGMTRQRNAKMECDTAVPQSKPKTTKTTTTNKAAASATKPPPAIAQSQQMTQKSMPVSEVTTKIEPTSEEIQKRAYEIFLARGGAPGDPTNDWLRAERELRERRSSQGPTGKSRR